MVDPTAKLECQGLINALLPLAKKMLAQHGEFFPIGGGLQPDGEIAVLAAHEGEERPPSQKLIDSLLATFRQAAAAKTYRATAILFDVRTVPPGATEKTDAVAVRLDHESGYSVIVMYPYRIESGEVQLSAPFATRGPGDVFR